MVAQVMRTSVGRGWGSSAAATVARTRITAHSKDMISSGVTSASKVDSTDKQALLTMCPPQRQAQSHQRLPTTMQLTSLKTQRHTLHASWPTPDNAKNEAQIQAQRTQGVLAEALQERGWSVRRLCRRERVLADTGGGGSRRLT